MAGPKVGQRARGSDLPHRPTQPPRPTTPASGTGPTNEVREPKAGPPKAAMNPPQPGESQKNANPVRESVRDLSHPGGEDDD